MTEQVLVEAHVDTMVGTADPGAAFEELRRALARIQSDDFALADDPAVVRALRSVILKFKNVRGRKGSFLGVGLSPFIQDLLNRIDPEQATA